MYLIDENREKTKPGRRKIRGKESWLQIIKPDDVDYQGWKKLTSCWFGDRIKFAILLISINAEVCDVVGNSKILVCLALLLISYQPCFMLSLLFSGCSRCDILYLLMQVASRRKIERDRYQSARRKMYV